MYQQKILTPQGEIPLEDIQIGAEVIGYNYETKQQEIYILTHKSAYGGKAYCSGDEYKYRFNKKKNWIEINGKYSFIPHQSLYANGRVVHAFELKVGDFIELVDGTAITVKSLRTIELETPKYLVTIEKKQTMLQKLFKKKPKQFHTYYINGVLAHNSSRFFVGSGTNWSSTGSWSGSSGGSSGSSVPTASDDVFLDSNSPGNLTIDTAGTCRSIDCTGFTHTLTHNSALTVAVGTSSNAASNIALKFVTGMTYTVVNAGNSGWNFISTSATQQTIDGASKNFPNVTINGSGSSYQLVGILNIPSATLRITNGIFDTNGQNCTWSLFGLGAGTKTLTLGSSTITMTNGSTAWDAGTNVSNFTFNANTSTINFTANAAGLTIQGGNLTYNNVNITNSNQTTFNGSNTFNNFTCNTGTSGNGHMVIIINGSMTVVGTLTLIGTDSATNAGRVFLHSGTLGTAVTVTAAAVSLTNVDFQDIIGAGAAAPFSGTSIGDGLGNTNITVTSAVTKYWVGNGGDWKNFASHWASSSGGSAGAYIPLPQDTAIFDSNSITSTGQTITNNGNPGNLKNLCKNLDFSLVANSPAFDPLSGTTAIIYGNLALNSGMTIIRHDSNTYFNLQGRSSQTITTAGVTIKIPVAMGAPGCTYTLQDNFVSDITFISGRGMIMQAGIFDANDFNVTVASIDFRNNGFTKVVNMKSGTWTIGGIDVSGTSTKAWDISAQASALTLNAGTSTLVFSNISSSSKTFAGGGKIYNNVSVSGGGTGVFTISGSNTINQLTLSGSTTVTFTISTTQTITSISWTGSSGNLVTLNSSTAGTQANISLATPQEGTWLSVKDINASNQTLYAGHNSTNVSNNTNVIFADFFTQALSDSVSLTGSLQKATGKFFTPTLSLTESIQKQISKNLPVITKNIHVLVVGGGGGGGARTGGGGGGGGVIDNTSYAVTSGSSYTVTVGSGGAHGVNSPGQDGTNGGNSVFDGLTALGGGAGGTGTATLNGFSGGSGGGAADTGTGGTGTTGQGNAGGNGVNTTVFGSGGGGGATAAGGTTIGNVSGAGGSGYTSSISGLAVTYAGGGGGGSDDFRLGNGGLGGTGGGGNGANANASTTPATAGSANTGGGGGGGGNISNVDAADGGSGIVIISAPIGIINTALTTGGVHTQVGGNDIYTFTTSGTWNLFLLDPVVLSEIVIRSIMHNLSDTFTPVETLIKAIVKTPFIESAISFIESLQRQTGKTYTANISFNEALIRFVTKQLSDSLSLSEVITKITNYLLTLTDSISLSETITKQKGKLINDTVTFSESLQHLFGKLFIDSISLIDTIKEHVRIFGQKLFSRRTGLFTKKSSDLYNKKNGDLYN